MSFILLNLWKYAPRQLTPAQEFCIQHNIEDSILYQNQPLLELWTEALIMERRIKCIIDTKLTWQERAPLLRQVNVLRSILSHIKVR